MQLYKPIPTNQFYASPFKFHKTNQRNSITLHKKMDVKYRQHDKLTMPQAQEHDRYMPVLDIAFIDTFRSKTEMIHNIR